VLFDKRPSATVKRGACRTCNSCSGSDKFGDLDQDVDQGSFFRLGVHEGQVIAEELDRGLPQSWPRSELVVFCGGVPLRGVSQMKRLIATVLTVGLFVASSGSASACCLWPFGGWWGAGYGGYYSAGYAPYVPPMGYYSAGYAPMDCCAPACCDPCGAGGCSSGSCVGTNPAGSLKPETDTNFEKGTKDNGTYDEFDRNPPRRSRDDLDQPLDPADSQARKRPVDPDPVDDFRSRPMGGTAADDPAFELDPAGGQINNKPPMDDSALDIPPVDSASPADSPAPMNEAAPGAGDTESFLDLDKKANETKVEEIQIPLRSVSSTFNEVVAPKRLASRSLPAAAPKAKTSFAGKSTDDKSRSNAPVRWISVPMPEGNVRL
jgi:hypothetical protein